MKDVNKGLCLNDPHQSYPSTGFKSTSAALYSESTMVSDSAASDVTASHSAVKYGACCICSCSNILGNFFLFKCHVRIAANSSFSFSFTQSVDSRV